jgi:hypothetical protein
MILGLGVGGKVIAELTRKSQKNEEDVNGTVSHLQFLGGHFKLVVSYFLRFKATASRMSFLNASSLILSPSWMSMARLTVPA